MKTLVKFNPLRVALVVGDESTDVVVIDESGNPAYYIATIYSPLIELHDGHPFEAQISSVPDEEA